MPRTIVAAGTKRAAEAGAAAAERGGNAVDAAVAACAVSLCTEPGIVAPGSGAFITIWPAGEDPLTIDAYCEMPGRTAPADRFGQGRPISMDYGGGVTTVVGHGSVATPGAFAGLDLAARRHGRLPLAVLLEDAVRWTRNGFPLSQASATYLSYSHDLVFGWQPESRRLLHHGDGTLLEVGERVVIEELADTLERIGSEGAADLYTGELAGRITAEIEGGRGLLSAADLAAYRAVERTPITIDLKGWTIATNPPPAFGGATLAAMLALLAARGFTGWDAGGIVDLVAVQEAVMAYRRSRLEVPGLLDPAVRQLLEAAAAADLEGLVASSSTTHVSTVDDEGNACAITASAGYGSGVLVRGTGMWLNNCLGELELFPGGFHSLPPGTRLPSNMAPTVARAADGSAMAIGSPGADRITTALLAGLVNYLLLEMPLDEAIAHPRVHAETFEGEPAVAFEGWLPVAALEEGRRLRHFSDVSMYFGGVQAALWKPGEGLSAAADPRRSGATAVGGR